MDKKYQVEIQSRGRQREIEWTETVGSDISMRGAKSAASRYIKRHVFKSDYDRINKASEGGRRQTWTIE